jgi:hypothetical protein
MHINLTTVSILDEADDYGTSYANRLASLADVLIERGSEVDAAT